MNNRAPSGHHLINLAACLGFVLVQLDVSIVNVGLQSLKTAYHASITDLEWVINAYALVFAALLLSSGALTGRFGAKKVFIFGVSVFIAASVACAFAPSIMTLNVMRAVQGVGAAFLVPSSLTILRIYNDDPKVRSGAVAMWAAAGAMALVAGPVIGGILIEYFGWKSIFLINFPLGLLCSFIILFYAPAKPIFPQHINLPSQILLALSLALFTFLMTESGRYGWTSTLSVGIIAATVMAVLFFRYFEKRSAAPVIDEEITGNTLIKSAVIIGFLCNLVFYGAVFIFSIFFQSQLQLSALETGVAFIPMMACTALINFSSKWFSWWFSIRTLSLFGSLISAAGFVYLMFISHSWGPSELFIPMMLLGSGTSFAMPIMTNLILSESSHQAAGSASALFNCARQMGGVTGVALFGLLLTIQGESTMFAGLKMIALSATILTFFWMYLSYCRLPRRGLHTDNQAST